MIANVPDGDALVAPTVWTHVRNIVTVASVFALFLWLASAVGLGHAFAWFYLRRTARLSTDLPVLDFGVVLYLIHLVVWGN